MGQCRLFGAGFGARLAAKPCELTENWFQMGRGEGPGQFGTAFGCARMRPARASGPKTARKLTPGTGSTLEQYGQGTMKFIRIATTDFRFCALVDKAYA